MEHSVYEDSPSCYGYKASKNCYYRLHGSVNTVVTMTSKSTGKRKNFDPL